MSPAPFKKLLREAKQTMDALARFVWPGRCASCNVYLLPDEHLFCEACRAAITPAGAFVSPAECDAAWAALLYDGPVRDAIRRWKYDGREAVGRGLAEELARTQLAHENALELPATGLSIVPIPLHPTRARERGFDQAEILAHAIWKSLRAQGSRPIFAPRALRRLRPTAAQAELPREERQRNVAEAFGTTGALKGTVCLVDDVVTTGATATACATVLRAAGAEHVIVLALATRGDLI